MHDLSDIYAVFYAAPDVDKEATVQIYEHLGARIAGRKSTRTNAVICHPSLQDLSPKDIAKVQALQAAGYRLVQHSDVAEAQGEVIDVEDQKNDTNAQLAVQIITTRGEKFTVRH